ncbi:MAG TPA: hypothetical protein PK926_05095 [Spirochaetota bacterium]|mgnify:CR=1 FL=1|nr:hypothetical protein [Spirochaetota bacterium]HPI88161.1 hypothetical protein [Spirochaetota bacterium]HPR47936.1 hypothetical protein [Spirochaetota bacterium]
MAMDLAISNWIVEYHVLVHHTIYIAALIIGFICIFGCVRFGIAVYRRKKGIYPPATSMMEDH